MEDYCKAFNGKIVEYGFTYDSGQNKEWLSVEELRQQIIDHVDADFVV
jgi:UDP-N-acetylglucosamine 4,6-dehydratase/5-epimerase